MSLDIQFTATRMVTVDNFNLTHNFIVMAEKAGVYKALWHPTTLGIKNAAELLPYIEGALQNLYASPNYYEDFEAPNGHGTYWQFIDSLEALNKTCNDNLDANFQSFS